MTTPNKRKMHGDDELLINLRNDDTGLLGNYDRLKNVKSRFRDFDSSSSSWI